MKTVTLVTWNRPELLAGTLHYLKQNFTNGYTLYVGMEPGSSQIETLIGRVDFMPVVSWVNPYRKGVNINAFTTIARAFDDGSEFNVHIEDDVLLSPDALNLANWYFELQDRTNHLGLFFCGPWSNPAWPYCVHRVEPTAVAPGAGFCISQWQWATIWSRHWFSGEAMYWDKNIEAWAMREKPIVLRPRFVRSKCAGLRGLTHHGANDEFFVSNPMSRLKHSHFHWRD